MSNASKVEEAQRAVEAAERSLNDAEQAHRDSPTDKTAADVARMTKRLDLARATLAKRTEQAQAAARVDAAAQSHADARKAERGIAASDGGVGIASPRLLQARERTAETAAQLAEAREALRDDALPIDADEGASMRADLERVREQLAKIEERHGRAEGEFSAAPSDAAWSAVISLRAERARLEAERTTLEALVFEAERSDRERAEQQARAKLEALAAKQRESAERELLALAGKLSGAKVAASVRAFMNATSAYYDSIVALNAAIGEHNAAMMKAAELAPLAGRTAPEAEPLHWLQVVSSLKWWQSLARSTRDTGAFEVNLAATTESQPRGMLAKIFEMATSTARVQPQFQH